MLSLHGLTCPGSYSGYGVDLDLKKAGYSFPGLHSECYYLGACDVYSSQHKLRPPWLIEGLALINANMVPQIRLIRPVYSNGRRKRQPILNSSAHLTGIRLSLPPCKTNRRWVEDVLPHMVEEGRHHGVFFFIIVYIVELCIYHSLRVCFLTPHFSFMEFSW